MSFNKIPLFTALLSIFMLFSCSSSTVVADEKKSPQAVPVTKISAAMAPAAPNESTVIGTVSAYCEISSRLLNIRPEMVIYKITVLVESSNAVKDSADFASGKDGQDIELFTKVKPPSELFGKRIKAVITYRGDERGGSFWIRKLEVK